MENIVSGITEEWKSLQDLLAYSDINVDFKYLIKELPCKICSALPIITCAVLELDEDEEEVLCPAHCNVPINKEDFSIEEYINNQYDLIASANSTLNLNPLEEFYLIIEPLNINTVRKMYLMFGLDGVQVQNPLLKIYSQIIVKMICDCYEFNRYKDSKRGYNLLMRKLAHELQCPLNSVIKQSKDLVSSSTNVEDTAKSIIYAAEHAAAMLDKITEPEANSDIFGFSQPDKIIFNAKRVLEDTFRTMHSIMREKNIYVSYKNIDTEIYADIKMFRQIVYNLANNALKYGLKNSEIEVVSYISDNKYWFEVRNYGNSITDEDKANIFESGKRGSQAKKEKINGKGFGLSICKQIAEAHGGEIICNNDIADEVTFIVSISYENTRF